MKKVGNPGYGKVGVVVARGDDQYKTALSKWLRIRYIDGTGYEWIQKPGVELIT